MPTPKPAPFSNSAPMPDASDKTLLEQFASVFVGHGVEFLVIGGQAEYLFGATT